MLDSPQSNARRVARLLFIAATVAFMCLVFLLLLGASMEKELNHDEHMYVAGGVLLAEKFQVPYLDFPYLQMPNLAFIYAGLFSLLKWPGYYLLEARAFSTVCATASLGLIFAAVAGTLRGLAYGWRFLLAAGSVVAIMANPVFRYASGQAWNHDASVLLALGAFALVHRAARRGWPVRWTLPAGLLSGLVMGTRLTFAFAIPAFLGAMLLYPPAADVKPPWRERLRQLMIFGDGVMLGLVPSLVTFVLAPEQFIFGNIDYHQVNARFWERAGYDRAMDLSGKLDYLWAVATQPANLALVVGSVTLLVAALAFGRSAPTPSRFGLFFSGAVLCSLLLGALVPTPTWYQYFYAVVPFLVLVLAHAAASLYSMNTWSVAVLGLVLLMSVLLGQPGYSLRNLSDTQRWVPVQLHATGLEVSRYVGSSKVLTFAPLFALEGGVDIYDQFAVGPFLWRSEPLLEPGERRAQGLPSQEEFMTLMEKEPPAAILTGFEESLESPWIEFAQVHGYREIDMQGGKVLWLRKP